MDLFDKLRKKSLNRKIEKDLENNLYEILDMFDRVKQNVKSKLTSTTEAAAVLRAYCAKARNQLKEVEQIDKGIFIKFKPKFENLFAEIECYINNNNKTL